MGVVAISEVSGNAQQIELSGLNQIEKIDPLDIERDL
jgi:hypothetical protein